MSFSFTSLASKIAFSEDSQIAAELHKPLFRVLVSKSSLSNQFSGRRARVGGRPGEEKWTTFSGERKGNLEELLRFTREKNFFFFLARYGKLTQQSLMLDIKSWGLEFCKAAAKMNSHGWGFFLCVVHVWQPDRQPDIFKAQTQCTPLKKDFPLSLKNSCQHLLFIPSGLSAEMEFSSLNAECWDLS